MGKDLHTMDIIQQEKEKDISKAGLQPLNKEGEAMAEHARFTFDVVYTPSDPKR